LGDILTTTVWQNATAGSTSSIDITITSKVPDLDCGLVANCDLRQFNIPSGSTAALTISSNDYTKPKLSLKLEIPQIKNQYDLQGLSEFPTMATANIFSIDGKNPDGTSATITPVTGFTGNVVGQNASINSSPADMTTIKNLKISCATDNCGIFGTLPKSIKHLVFDNIEITGNTKNNIGILAGSATITENITDGTIYNVLVRNSTITGTGTSTSVGGFIGYIASAGSNLVLNKVAGINNEITGSENVGGLVGSTTGGKNTDIAVLGGTVSTNSTKGGLLFGQAIGNGSNIFTLQDAQAVATLAGTGQQLGGAIGYLNNNMDATKTVLVRIIALPKFAVTGTFKDKQIGLFAGKFDGTVNNTALDKHSFQNNRVYAAPNVGNITLDGSNKLTLTHATRDIEERGWNYNATTFKVMSSTISSSNYTTEDKKLFFSSSDNANAANGVKAPMYWHLNTSEMYPKQDDRPLTGLAGISFPTGGISSSDISTLTFNYFPLKKFGNWPITNLLLSGSSLQASNGTQIASGNSIIPAHYTTCTKEYYAYLNHFYDNYNPRTLVNATTCPTVTSIADRKNSQFEDVSSATNKHWIDNYPTSSGSVNNSSFTPSISSVLLKYLQDKGYQIEIGKD
jgi:hypothetical protein